MKIIDSFISEIEQETVATRRMLERVSDGKLAWKPHEKSMILGRLAMHVATTPGDIANMRQNTSSIS